MGKGEVKLRARLLDSEGIHAVDLQARDVVTALEVLGRLYDKEEGAGQNR